MAHHCHATNCKIQVQPKMFMCKKHWFMLTFRLRNKIWKYYREGQEDDKQPSRQYCLAAIECLEYIANREGITADIKLYEIYMPEAE